MITGMMCFCFLIGCAVTGDSWPGERDAENNSESCWRRRVPWRDCLRTQADPVQDEGSSWERKGRVALICSGEVIVGWSACVQRCYIWAHAHTHIHINTHTSALTQMHTCVHMYTNMHTYTHTHTCTQTHAHTLTPCTHRHTSAYMHTCT